VVFSPNGKLAYVNHMHAQVLDVIDVASRKIVNRVPIPAEARRVLRRGDLADGREIWPGHAHERQDDRRGQCADLKVERAAHRTAHQPPQLRHGRRVDYAYQTVGGPERDPRVPPVARTGHRRSWSRPSTTTVSGPTASGPEPDNTRIYVALQNLTRWTSSTPGRCPSSRTCDRSVADGFGVRRAQWSCDNAESGEAGSWYAGGGHTASAARYLRQGKCADP